MSSPSLPKSKLPYFVLEALNSLGTTYYFYYIYFFTQDYFGFSKVQNFALAAGWGVFYTGFSIIGGKIGQRRGYFNALKLGFLIMALSIGAGPFFFGSLIAQLLIFVVAIFGMALTWPSLEALVSEGVPASGLQRNLSIYNLVWAGFGAIAYFSAGTMIKALSFKAMFIVPAAIAALQLIIIIVVAKRLSHDAQPTEPVLEPGKALVDDDSEEQKRSPIPAAVFLKMAWLGNPFGYLAVNTVISVIPALADRLELSVQWAGIFYSFWLFVRTASFGLLWWWTGWHYRFRWLLTAYIAMGLSFVVILTVPNLIVLLFAQALFGLSLGLLYSSSLYYSMHVGDTKAEHGGVHEAMIGAGSFAGPAVSALSLHFLPRHQASGAIAVAVLLFGGLAALLCLRFKGKKS